MRAVFAGFGLAAVILAALITLGCCQSASAVPAVKVTAPAASLRQQVQYREHRTRHGFVKCYRDLVIGAYRCHYYHYW